MVNQNNHCDIIHLNDKHRHLFTPVDSPPSEAAFHSDRTRGTAHCCLSWRSRCRYQNCRQTGALCWTSSQRPVGALLNRPCCRQDTRTLPRPPRSPRLFYLNPRPEHHTVSDIFTYCWQLTSRTHTYYVYREKGRQALPWTGCQRAANRGQATFREDHESTNYLERSQESW